jgi:DNA helicase HerA-like ATPase
VGDLDKPRLVFFFDEAHLLFTGAPKALLEKVEQVVRLIRSKGVGIYFVTQNPLDIPDTVLGQLGNRVQHALRAFTPRDQKAVKTAAQTMRPNPGLDIEAAITELGVGEALVSMLDAKGIPTPTERAWLVAPGSRIGPATDAERQTVRQASLFGLKYDQAIDRESAYEVLAKKATDAAANGAAGATQAGGTAAGKDDGLMGVVNDFLFGSTGPRGGKKDGLVQSMIKTETKRAATKVLRGVLGSLFGGKR